MPSRALLLVALLVGARAARAGSDGGSAVSPRAKPPKPAAAAPSIDLGIPSFGEIPRDTQLRKTHVQAPPDGPSVTAVSAAYSVVRVSHAKAFIRTPTGSL